MVEHREVAGALRRVGGGGAQRAVRKPAEQPQPVIDRDHDDVLARGQDRGVRLRTIAEARLPPP